MFQVEQKPGKSPDNNKQANTNNLGLGINPAEMLREQNRAMQRNSGLSQNSSEPLQMQEEDEELLAKKEPAQMMVEEEEKKIQAKSDPAQMQQEEEDIKLKKGQQKSENSASKSVNSFAHLNMALQMKMQDSFGTSFQDVNIHQNDGSASQMGALAYTQGNNVHFAPGQFNPNTQGGQELLGHELTHVVQQRQGRVQPTKQGKGMKVNDDNALEKEADVMGEKVAAGKEVNNTLKDTKGIYSNLNQQNAVQYKLVLTGDDANRARVLTILNTNLFGYRAIIDDTTGEVTLEATDVQGPPTPAQQAMYDHLNTIISNEATTSIGVESEDDNILGGNYNSEQIDIADIEALAGNEGMSDAGALLHEIVEQYFKQVHNEPYNEPGQGEFSGAHGSAIEAEKDLNDLQRGTITIVSQTTNEDGVMEIVVDVPYTRPDGSGRMTRLYIEGGNIVRSTERDIPKTN
jgi:hypothetical protein